MFKFKGKEYDSVEKCCDELGVSYYAVTTDASRHNISHKKAVEKQLQKEPFEFRGKSYKTKNECCKEYGLKYANVKQKAFQQGISFEESLEMSVQKPPKPDGNKIFYDGYMWKSKTCLCNAYGLVKETLYKYAKQKNITFLEAFEEMKLRRNNGRPTQKDIERNACFLFRGKYYTSIAEACAEFGIFYPNIKKSIDDGMSKPEALEYWVSAQEERDAKRIFVFHGKRYNSLRSCCKEYGIQPGKVRELVGDGMEKTEAISKLIYDNHGIVVDP